MATKFTYTDEEIAAIVKAYQADETLEMLAERYSKSVPSIRMKLVKLGVYVAKKPSKAKQHSSEGTNIPTTEKFSLPTSKAALVAHYKDCINYVGEAPF